MKSSPSSARAAWARVYRAHDTKLGRDVALKVLPDLFADDPERLARFQREARVLASLNHPNIASIYGLEESGDTRALVLELVEGPTLADHHRPRSAHPLHREALPMTNSTRSHLPWLSSVLAGCLAASTHVVADDWPQWRGPDRLAVWHETGIVDQLPDELEVTWRVPIRSGYSGPAVAGGRVFVTDWEEDPESRTVDGTERLVVLDEQTGELLWTREWPTSYRMLMFSYAVGPRATPTVDGDRVYVLGATGRLLCLNVETGALIWEKDYIADYDTSVPTWGVASAPLVDGDRLIALVGWRARCARDGVRQAHRRGDLARDRGHLRDGLRPAGHLRGGRHQTADRLASDRSDVTQPGNRRRVLGPALGSARERVGRHTGPRRRLPARVAVLSWVDDDAAQRRSP